MLVKVVNVKVIDNTKEPLASTCTTLISVQILKTFFFLPWIMDLPRFESHATEYYYSLNDNGRFEQVVLQDSSLVNDTLSYYSDTQKLSNSAK